MQLRLITNKLYCRIVNEKLIHYFADYDPRAPTALHGMGSRQGSDEIRLERWSMQERWELRTDRRPGDVRDLLEILLQNRAMEAGQLHPDIRDLAGYVVMKGIDEAARVVTGHMAKGGKIVLVSDYDCDGITSLAQASRFFRETGYSRFETFIPLRSEGYGMPPRAVHAHSDASLFLIFDCGTRDVEGISLARSREIDTVVIDHHEVPSNGTAPASVLVNPKQPGCHSVFKDFSASGLTLLFLTRLRKALGEGFPHPKLGGHYLQLAALGTIADMVPLVEGNRILAHQGLASLNANASTPMRLLIESAGLERKRLTARHLGYRLGPRINVAGRLADASLAHDLLTCQDEERGAQLALELNRLNIQRQTDEQRIMEEIRGRIKEVPPGRRTLVMGDPDWPAGLVGILASRVLQDLRLGAVVILSIDESAGIARGSARGIQGLDLHRALSDCDDLLLKWGGHQMAAGLTLEAHAIDDFSARLEAVVSGQPPALFQWRRAVDVCIDPLWVTPELEYALRDLEPHGVGNPPPAFLFRDVTIRPRGCFGPRRNHLRVLLADRLPGILWRALERPDHSRLLNGGTRDVVFQLAWDDYRNEPFCDIKAVGNMPPF